MATLDNLLHANKFEQRPLAEGEEDALMKSYVEMLSNPKVNDWKKPEINSKSTTDIQKKKLEVLEKMLDFLMKI